MRVTRYGEADREAWDRFVQDSKNGTFLFLRDYMEYHRARFADHSLLVWNGDGELAALLPGNADGPRYVSHGGLTYGGFVTDAAMKLPRMIEVFEHALAYLQSQGFDAVVYKTIPHIYHAVPAEEDRYALFLCGARFLRRGVLTVIGGSARLPFQKRRERSLEKARRQGLAVRESEDVAEFWAMVEEVLAARYGVKPVHALGEIAALRARFPRNIRLFGCFHGRDLVAGVVVFESTRVAHVQYIAAREEGRRLGALDLVFHDLLSGAYREKPVFDFGTSDDEHGRSLNRGLIDQKEGFGARVVVHDHCEIDLAAWRPGQLRAVLR